MADVDILFTPTRLGALTVRNRVLMAPMTRSRAPAQLGNTPTPLMAEYYAQRAGAGLVITEGTQVSPLGIGYLDTPGIHTSRQVAAWSNVTRAVHDRGGKIFAQLWHVGRVSHPDFHDGAVPIAPSAIAATGAVNTPAGKRVLPVPRALATTEIPVVIAQFAVASAQAKTAGFDGVELHGANGYLIEQFLYDGSNRRSDRYGGCVENRARFLLEVFDAVAAVWGSDRVGVRLSPSSQSYGISESDRPAIFAHVARSLDSRSAAYLHVVEPLDDRTIAPRIAPVIRANFHGAVIANGGYTRETAAHAIACGDATAVSFATAFLANPDLVERFLINVPLNVPDRTTFYGGDQHGYTDYPIWNEELRHDARHHYERR